MLCPAARKASSAADTRAPLASIKILTARPSSFSFVKTASIIKFSYAWPNLTITAVLSMFKTNFCDVPAFNLVDPVNTSAPTPTAIAIFANRASGISRFAITAIVVAPRPRANFIAPKTYGVVPLAAIPTTTSLLPNLNRRKSRAPFSAESSAPSTAPVTARLPPAISATICFREIPNVGGHSAASKTAILPLDPAPT